MKIQGHESFDARERYTLFSTWAPRPAGDTADAERERINLDITLEPLRVGVYTLLAKRLPEPKAPIQLVTDDNGRVLRYANDGPAELRGKPIHALDVQDDRFREATKEHELLQAVAMLCESTRNTPAAELEWSTPWPEEDGASSSVWRTFYRRRLEELEAAGVPMGNVLRCVARIMSISGMDSGRLRDLQESFS